jgi:hypothetical protein
MTQNDLPSAAKSLRDQVLRLRPDIAHVRLRFFLAFLGIALVLTSAVTGGLLAFYPHVRAIFPLAVSLPLLLSFVVFRLCNRLYQNKIRLMLIESLSITSGFQLSPDPFFSSKAMIAHAILPVSGAISGGDAFTGSYNDTPLVLQDLSIGRSGPPMRCFAVRIRLRRPFDGHTVVTTANAAKTYFKGQFTDTYGKVGVTNMKYDRQVEIFATERSEARLAVDAVFIELLMDTGLMLKSRWVAASFLKNDLVMLFDSAKPLMHVPPLWAPVGADNLMQIYRHFESCFKIVDGIRASRYL